MQPRVPRAPVTRTRVASLPQTDGTAEPQALQRTRSNTQKKKKEKKLQCAKGKPDARKRRLLAMRRKSGQGCTLHMHGLHEPCPARFVSPSCSSAWGNYSPTAAATSRVVAVALTVDAAPGGWGVPPPTARHDGRVHPRRHPRAKVAGKGIRRLYECPLPHHPPATYCHNQPAIEINGAVKLKGIRRARAVTTAAATGVGVAVSHRPCPTPTAAAMGIPPAPSPPAAGGADAGRAGRRVFLAGPGRDRTDLCPSHLACQTVQGRLEGRGRRPSWTAIP